MASDFQIKVMKQNRFEASVKADAYRFQMLHDNVDMATLAVLIESYRTEVEFACQSDIQIHEATRVTHLTGII